MLKSKYILIVGLGAILSFSAFSVKAENLRLSFEATNSFPSGTFRAEDNPEAGVQEKIINQANFVKINSLAKDNPVYDLSRKVGQLLFSPAGEDGVGGICTGSLVGHDLFLTNHHCVADAKPGDKYYVAMENLSGLNSMPEGSFTSVTSIVRVDAYLDFALLQLNAPLGLKYGWLEIERNPAAIRAVKKVMIIQHPQGRPKEVVLEDTDVVRHVGKFIHYIADTEGGSSGSPVIELSGNRIIGLHHVGTKTYNEAVRIDVIAELLSIYLPDASEDTAATPAVSSSGESAQNSSPAASPAKKPKDEGGMQAITE
jgi:V8-like Glu-specific endopeptidase